MMLDFLVIGAQKAGTTWLWNMLVQHPGVHVTPFKEVHFFDVLHLGVNRGHRLRQIDRMVDLALGQTTDPARIAYLRRLKDRDFAFTEGWYRHLFSQAREGEIKGEITPYYCALPDQGIEHVKQLGPSVRLIYLVRDPIKRGISSLRQMGRNRDPEELLTSADYFARGDYASNVPRWERHFPADRILYLPFGDIRTDPMAIIHASERHLGLNPHAHYSRMEETIASTVEREIEVSEAAVARISALFESQYGFLRKRFGDDFMSRIA